MTIGSEDPINLSLHRNLEALAQQFSNQPRGSTTAHELGKHSGNRIRKAQALGPRMGVGL
jgi:hypothetical protein